jgi:[ribosomal protein S5]-alanine N-acetyltransferase
MVEFTLRSWETADIHDLFTNANNAKIASNLTNKFPYPYTMESGQNFIAFAQAELHHKIFCIEVNGEACGGIGIHVQDDIFDTNAELGYWLAEKHWGKGIISRAIAQAVDYGFRHFNITRIFARPFGSNMASQTVLEKNNFVLEGRFEKTILKNGIFEDELVYAVRKSDWDNRKRNA